MKVCNADILPKKKNEKEVEIDSFLLNDSIHIEQKLAKTQMGFYWFHAEQSSFFASDQIAGK